MLDADTPRREVPGAGALVIVNAAFVPVSYNAEALRILTYPQDAAQIPSVPRQIELKLNSLFPRCTPPKTGAVAFQSGKRRYGIRVYSMDTPRKEGSADAAYALVLERQERQAVDLSTVLDQFRLTPREEETLRCLLEGMTSKEIAGRMGISPHTVKAFLRLVMSKMQVTSRSGIIGKIVHVNR
jgi:DNA-binding CsgD family transcriptional regulator